MDGIHGIVGGVGHLLGINGDESPSPSTSPAPSAPANPSPTKDATPTKTADPTVGPSAHPTADPTAGPSENPSKPAASSAEPAPSETELPCLGLRVYGKVADSDGLPFTSDKPGELKVDKLTMIEATYVGVADMPTKTRGTVKALQFNMKTAINDGFKLTIDEPHGGQTVIQSDVLTTDQNVRFYTPRFEGKFFGVIPMTFTPEQPPPLTLPKMVFTDVKIDLAYVRCDVLTGKPMHISETP